MLLYIVRHGETDWNKAGKVQGRTDIPLNERGRYLAEATAEGMKDVRIDFCNPSPLIRGKATAQFLLGKEKFLWLKKNALRRFVSESVKE